MSFLELQKKSIPILLLMISTSIQTAPNSIRCPSLNKIQQSALLISHVDKPSNHYYAITNGPAFSDSDLYWTVGTGGIVAGSAGEALAKAQLVASNVSIMQSEFAYEFEKYYCGYFSSNHSVEIVATALFEK